MIRRTWGNTDLADRWHRNGGERLSVSLARVLRPTKIGHCNHGLVPASRIDKDSHPPAVLFAIVTYD